MLKFHSSELVIDSLNDYFSGLVEFLATCLLAGFATLLYKLHKLLFFQLSREFAFSIDLVVLFFTMRFLISLKDMFDYLITSSTGTFVAGNCRWLELLMLLGFFSPPESWRVIRIVITSCCIRGWFMLLKNLRIQKLEGNKWVINEGFQDCQKRFFACSHHTHCVLTSGSEITFDT